MIVSMKLLKRDFIFTFNYIYMCMSICGSVSTSAKPKESRRGT